jgi:hypothetical protein
MPIQITDPCTEQWNEMAPNTAGRHCDKCCKTVVDFSTWEADAIAAYLRKNSGPGVCGRLEITQTQRLAAISNNNVITDIVRKVLLCAGKIAAALLVISGFTATGCKEEPKLIADNKKPSKPDTSHISITESPYVMGLIDLRRLSDSSFKPKEADTTDR